MFMPMERWRTTPKVSARMRTIRSRGTALETRMEGILRAMRLPFVTQPNLPGRPDFRIRGTNVLIFCDSSFWHGRNKRNLEGRTFSRNRKLWIEKLAGNRRRDGLVSRKLRAAGWSVHRFWDTDILSSPQRVAGRLRGIVHGR